MHAETLVSPRPQAPTSQQQYMKVARWMVDFRNRYALDGRYNIVQSHLYRSQARAGGPALRLAQAVWDYDARCRYPTDKALKVGEENSFSHLWHNHRDRKKVNYHVWQAIEAFGKQRIAAFGEPMLATVHQPDIDAPQPLRHAIRMLDTALLIGPVDVRRHPVVHKAMVAIATAHPRDEKLIMSVLHATNAFAVWRADTTDILAYDAFKQAANAALNLQYLNRGYLQHKANGLNGAITALGSQLHRTPA